MAVALKRRGIHNVRANYRKAGRAARQVCGLKSKAETKSMAPAVGGRHGGFPPIKMGKAVFRVAPLPLKIAQPFMAGTRCPPSSKVPSGTKDPCGWPSLAHGHPAFVRTKTYRINYIFRPPESAAPALPALQVRPTVWRLNLTVMASEMRPVGTLF